jgi:hypothetical protein
MFGVEGHLIPPAQYGTTEKGKSLLVYGVPPPRCCTFVPCIACSCLWLKSLAVVV